MPFASKVGSGGVIGVSLIERTVLGAECSRMANQWKRRRRRWVAGIPLLLALMMDTAGQDLIEYSLTAGFVATAAGAVMPAISNNISKVFSHVSSVLKVAASQS